MIFLICNLFFGGIRDIAVVEAAFLYDIRFCVRLPTYLGLFYRSNLQIQGPSRYRVFNLMFRSNQGLRTPNEGINQKNLKFWADVAAKICFGSIYKLGIEI